MDRLRFGTAGIPLSTNPRNTLNGIARVGELNLGCMELEFVQNVNISESIAPEVKAQAERNGVILSAHGSYYINLNAREVEKIEQSIKRILHGARVLSKCGGRSITFHAGFYLGEDRQKVYNRIKRHLATIEEEFKAQKITLDLRPETTGKESQFGTLEEIVSLSNELERVLPCIDFPHIFARSGGKFNTYEEFRSTLEFLDKNLGRRILDNMHIHMEGIAYTQKGERNHLPLRESKFNYVDLLKALKEFDTKGIIISESPIIEEDAILLKNTYESF